MSLTASQDIPSHRLYGVSFRPYGGRELKLLSVKELINPTSFNVLQNATYGGLYDPALGSGVQDRDDMCTTCGQGSLDCPGHMGRITLPLPVFNPVTFKTMFSICRLMCFNCDRLLTRRAASYLFNRQMVALDLGLVVAVYDLEVIYRNCLTNGNNEFFIDCDGFEDLKQDLDKCLKAAMNALKSGHKKAAEVRNVVECRSAIYKEFLQRAPSSRGRCPHCRGILRPLRQELFSRIFFGAKSTRAPRQRKDLEENLFPDTPISGSTAVPMEEETAEYKAMLSQQTILTPAAAKEHFRRLWKNNNDIVRWVIGAFRDDRGAVVDCKTEEGVRNKGEEEVMVKEEEFPTDLFFIDELLVPPSCFRPPAKMKGRLYDNPQTVNLAAVLKEAAVLRELLSQHIGAFQNTDVVLKEGETLVEKIHSQWVIVQSWVNAIIDSSLGKVLKEVKPGIKQTLERKEGMFRKFMMGKRVNYAARSVISPDPYIATNEVGVPEVFARKLTYCEHVTPWNVQELRQCVINGPMNHPGATFVELEDGSRIMLNAKNQIQRESLAKQLLTPSSATIPFDCNKKVHRHIKNGDIVIMNRQPTLHKPSMQAHKVRVLKTEKTLRLNYSSCKAYNADFDGDEMNLHFPQNELARSESYFLANADSQYLVPKDGTPLAGLIQDHMVSGVTLMLRGQFFERWQYHQLVFAALTDLPTELKQLPPAIVKPRPLWTGKQVLSTLLLNLIPAGKPALSLTGVAKISEKCWLNTVMAEWLERKHRGDFEPVDDDGTSSSKKRSKKRSMNSLERKSLAELKSIFERLSESHVVIRNGELLVGILDKNHYGPTPYGLVHCCYELYGGEMAGKFLTCLEKLFTSFLQYHGFTLGMLDILVTDEANAKRHRLMKKCRRSGPAVVAHVFNLPVKTTEKTCLMEMIRAAHFSKDPTEMQLIDVAMKSNTDSFQNDIANVCMPKGLIRQFPKNGLQLMVLSGAKGTTVNCMQISCLLGQIDLEGRRPPIMLSGKSLPTFLPYDMTPRAGGFVDGRFLTGIRTPEYFFHCMAGREGLVDTAVKTSRSGYLQRCLIKHMEGLTVKYDMTVRDSDGSVIQFYYGDDGLDIMKTPFLTAAQFPFLITNQLVIVTKNLLTEVKSKTNTDQAPILNEQLQAWRTKNSNRDSTQKVRSSPFLRFSRGKLSKCVEDLNSGKTCSATIGSGGDGDGFEDIKKRPKCDELKKQLVQQWINLSTEKRERYSEKCRPRQPDPVMSRLRSDRYFGSVSERYESIINKYVSANPDHLLSDGTKVRKSRLYGRQLSTDRFYDLLYLKHLHALAHPGEAVGLLAAQSIGEPSTQMTLNTFHFAGRGEMNVTLGIPRLREILMTASANIKTPTMDIPLRDASEETTVEGRKLQHTLNRVFLSQVIENVVVKTSWSFSSGGSRSRLYRIHFNFLPYSQYHEDLNVTPSKILEMVERSFLQQLHVAIEKAIKDILKTKTVTTSVSSGRVQAGFEGRRDGGGEAAEEAEIKADEVSDDDDVVDDDMNDDDRDANKIRSRQQQERDYDGEDEEKKEMVEEEGEGREGMEGDESDMEEDIHDDARAEKKNEDDDEREEEEEGEDDENSRDRAEREERLSGAVESEEQASRATHEDDEQPKRKKKKKQMDERRVQRVINGVRSLMAYEYDVEGETWCSATFSSSLTSKDMDITSLLEREAKRAVICQVPGISRSVLVDPKQNRDGVKEPAMLRTEGVSIHEMYKYDKVLDLNQIYTNDIHAMANHYGIEAARTVIIKEIRDVFAAYGIGVDYRHLSVIADYMTFEGKYRAFNRTGIESNASPLQKMSFETTMMFLRQAIVNGAKDSLNSPSARIVTGRVVREGTGSFDLIQPLS